MLDNEIQYQDHITKLFPELTEGISKEENEIVVKSFTFQVTEDCNLCCSYCYQLDKHKKKMSLETAKAAIDFLFNHRQNEDFYFCEKITKGLVIEFIGGEPLLEAKLIEQICDYFETKCFENPDCPWGLFHIYQLSSNGTLYFSPDSQHLINKYRNLLHISVTVDGCKELHDKCRLFENGKPSYDLAIKAALDSKAKGNAATKITLSPDNIEYLFAGIKNMLSLDFRWLHINSAYEEGWTINDAKKLYQQLKLTAEWLVENHLEDKCYISLFDSAVYSKKDDRDFDKNWCGSTGCMLSVDADGNIYPCIRFMETSLNNEQIPYCFGNIYKGLGTTKIEKERINNLTSLTKTKQSTEECLNCPIEAGCSWCTGYNYQHFGRIDKRATYICYNHKAGALASKYFYKLCKDRDNYDKIVISEKIALEIISKEELENLKWEE